MENSVEQVRAGVGLYDYDNYNKTQSKPLNVITLEQIQTDKINWMITISIDTYNMWHNFLHFITIISVFLSYQIGFLLDGHSYNINTKFMFDLFLLSIKVIWNLI